MPRVRLDAEDLRRRGLVCPYAKLLFIGEAIRTFWEKNWWLISLVALLAFISSGIGMYIPGLLGAAVSFLITVIGFVVEPTL